MIIQIAAPRDTANAKRITQNSIRFPPPNSSPNRRLLAHDTMTKLRPVVHRNVVASTTSPWGSMTDEPTADTRMPAGTTGGSPSDRPPSATTREYPKRTTIPKKSMAKPNTMGSPANHNHPTVVTLLAISAITAPR